MDLKVDLKGKTALVTGASSGIGAGIARELAGCGARVGVHYFQTVSGAQSTLEEIERQGGSGFLVQGDVSRLESVQTMMQEVTAQTDGTLHLLINNAGDLMRRSPLATMGEELWDQVIDLNLKSVQLVTQAALPLLRKASGARIVNVSSIAGQEGGGGGSGAYAAAKAGVLALTKAYAKELAPEGITVNAISPGLIGTRFHDRYSSSEKRQNTVSRTPAGREGTPEDNAAAVLYLVSEAAGFITGTTLDVNGGIYLR
ncbi:MAG: SDR family NAD(P)-dependent oxidoreductase [bacterium]|jgi:3-oxoacyl-[acyl-carrier protein] reductase